MIRDQACPIRGVVVDGISIVSRQLSGAWNRITQLPEQICSHTCILQPQACRLPLALHRAVVGSNLYTILFQQAGLVSLLACRSVRCDPRISPVVGCAPGRRVEMESAEGDVGQGEVGGEIETLAKLVGVRAIATQTEALVANGNHVVRVKGAYIVR